MFSKKGQFKVRVKIIVNFLKIQECLIKFLLILFFKKGISKCEWKLRTCTSGQLGHNKRNAWWRGAKEYKVCHFTKWKRKKTCFRIIFHIAKVDGKVLRNTKFVKSQVLPCLSWSLEFFWAKLKRCDTKCGNFKN